MAEQYQQILTSVGVAPGASVVLPHNLNAGGVKKFPDEVAFDANSPGFSLTAASVNSITVKNNGLIAASVEVRVTWDHTILRAYGDAAVKQLVGVPIVIGGFGSAGGGGASVPDQVFTYTHAGGADSDFFITFATQVPPQPDRPDDNYVPMVECGGCASIYTFDKPDAAAGDRTTAQFRVIASANVQDGDKFDIVIKQRT